MKGNSPYCSVVTGQQPESDRDQPVPHALHQVSVHGGRNLLGPVENQSKQQLTLPEIAAGNNTDQLSCTLSDLHTCTLPSVSTSPVLSSQEGRLSSTPIILPGISVSLPSVSQSTALVLNPANETRRLRLHSSIVSIQGESIDCSSHKSAFNYPRIMDAGTLLQQLHDDHHDCEFGFEQFPATGLLEPGQINMYLENLKETQELVKKVSRNFSRICSGDTDGIDQAVKEDWRTKTSKLSTDLQGYRGEIMRKVIDLRAAPAVAAPSLQRQATEQLTNTQTAQEHSEATSASLPPHVDVATIAPLLHTLSLTKSTDEARLKNQATCEARGRISNIKLDLEDITTEYGQYLDWEIAENHEIEDAMSSLKKWKEKMMKVRKELSTLKGTIEAHEIEELQEELACLSRQVTKTGTELDEAINQIKVADKNKGLYSDRKAKSSPVKLPTFSGNQSEDFLEFLEKFSKAVIANKIPKEDQLDKLREVLSGKAKAQVPAKTEDIDRAWELLKSAFGDPMLLLKYRKQALGRIGAYPENATKNNPQKVVEWCLEMERAIDDVVKLGDREARLEFVAFNDDTINEVVDLFPMRLVFKMEKLDLEGRDKLLAISGIVEDERKILQKMAIRALNSVIPKKTMVTTVHTSDDEEPPITRVKKALSVKPKNLSLYANPKKNPLCRICKRLEFQGDNKDLYEAHQGNYPTHCPRWAGMNNEERAKLAREAKFCLYCLDPKVNFNRYEHPKVCPVRTQKNKYSCTNERCRLHSWICSKHKSENAELLQGFADEMTKRNIAFTYGVQPTSPQDTQSNAWIPTTSLTPMEETSDASSVSRLAMEMRSSNKKSPGENTSGINEPVLPIGDVISQLKELTPEGETLVTKLKDPPLFMFSTTPGKDKDVQIFYDTGNSHCLFQTGTPANLYGVRTRCGPFSMGAVGNTTVWGGDEWACQPMTTRGHREILIGLEVPQITTNFPYVNLQEATMELKTSAPENEELQALKVPKYVGGECHVLLGIQYASHFPRLVHSLENGLGIYEVKLQPHSSQFTAAIAGPHHSFNFLTGKVGNVAHLLQKFTEGINYWKTSGPPAPKSLSLTPEEYDRAISMGRSELSSYGVPDTDNWNPENSTVVEEPTCAAHIAHYCGKPFLNHNNYPATPSSQGPRHRIVTDTRDDFLEIDDSTGELDCGWYEWSKQGITDQERPGHGEACAPLTCTYCTEDMRLNGDDIAQLTEDIINTAQGSLSGEPLCIEREMYKIHSASNFQASDPDLTTLRMFIAGQEALTKIEYRCPKCRNCAPCREAVETEKISLREEAEEAEIADSVKLDFANKQFICSLPMRGSPEDFLATNKRSAEKVLERQVKLYSKDQETKELILKAMAKLFDRGHVSLVSDLAPDQQALIDNSLVNYFIPWRVVFKPGSLSTPARPVFDCSSKTPTRLDGTGGRCLNDLMCKGRNMSFNLIKMLLRFSVGTHALSGDIKQFYNVFKLLPEHWHLQLFLWKKDMNPSNETVVAVIKTLIYGNKASAPQSEEGMKQFAEVVRKTNPRLADFLINSRFVDDLNDSVATKEDMDELQQNTDEELATLGVHIKGWAKTGSPPSPEISEGGLVGVAGMAWCPEVDSMEMKIPPLHFGKVIRGRLSSTTKLFQGEFGNLQHMEEFVPDNLSKRQVVSKYMSTFDPMGKLIPATSKMKRDLRDLMADTPTWDEAVSTEHRSTWVKNFMTLEALKGIKFTRPRMPTDAIDTRMRLMVIVDASKDIISVWAGVGFKRKNGKWSSAYLVGRCLLAPPDSTIPRHEMEALVAGSNMLWLLRQILNDWTDTFILAGDAQIPLFWILSDKKRLGLWHRTRSVQVRRGTPLKNIFHIQTSHNVADIPTRPDKLTSTDLGPGSAWETGLPWMEHEIDNVVQQGILTPIADLMMKPEDQTEYDEGFVLERSPDILTQGHLVHLASPERVQRTAARASYTKYIILPTKFNFPKVVRILGIVTKFVQAFKRKWSKKCGAELLLPPPIQFRSLLVLPNDLIQDNTPRLGLEFSALASYYRAANNTDCSSCTHVICTCTSLFRLDEKELQWALHYLYTCATKEVEEFVKPAIIAKIAIKSHGILFSKSRALDGQRFTCTGGLDDASLLKDHSINIHCPVIDRWSPLAYAIGDHIHTNIAKHAGFETCYRHSHSYVHIIQGYSLFQELGTDCVLCQKIHGRFLQAAFGPLDDAKFTLAPAFWMTQVDIWGPATVYVPGRERNTRSSKSLSSKVWVLVSVCVLTKLVNMQVVETHCAKGLSDGLTRLICEVGTPSRLLVDQDSALIKLLQEGRIELVNLESHIRTKTQMDFTVCPVSGHNAHGLVEAKIRVAQEGFSKCGASNLRLHATGLQTVVKMIECDMNDTPYGVIAGRSETNPPLLKLVSPSMMKIGRINSRSPSGPFSIPADPKDLLDRVQQTYATWFSLYQDVILPKYLLDLQPKWFKSDKDTQIGDVVFFRKREGKLDGPWQLGTVEETTRSRDGLIRRIEIKYFNASENFPRYTDRSIRSVIKLFNINEGTWRDDMTTVAEIAKTCGLSAELNELSGDSITIAKESDTANSDNTQDKPTSSEKACCQSHSKLALTTTGLTSTLTPMLSMPATLTPDNQVNTDSSSLFLDSAGPDFPFFSHYDPFLRDIASLGVDLHLN